MILVLLGIPGCGPAQEPIGDLPWKAADLRALEAPNVPDPANDLIAAYARLTKTDLELRFDLLGSPDPYGYELLVLVDTQPGGNSQLPWGQPAGLEWDLALRFPAQGVGRAFQASGAPALIRPRIQRLSVQDAAIVRLSRVELAKEITASPEAFHFQAHLLLPGSNLPADAIGPLAVNGPAPEQQAALLLAFWDTLPAATPAQALRRWNGAHTGPYGQRHGLSVLLEAAEQVQVPLALLDLKQPARLAALESLGGLTQVRQMAREKLLILPDTVSGDPRASAESLRISAQSSQQYRLPDSPFLFGAVENGSIPGAYRAVFASLQADRYLRQWGEQRLIPLPTIGSTPETMDETQVDAEGLTVPIREALLRYALSPETDGVLVLGGSLPTSAWGDLLMAEPALAYLAGHPWVHVLNGDDLLRYPARDGAPDCPDLLCYPEPAAENPNAPAILEALRGAPAGLFTDLAWQAYWRLSEPSADEKLQAMRSGYLGQAGALLAAARWNAAPRPQTSCAEDLDWDGAPECVLSSEEVFLVIDPQGARLVLAAARQNGQPYQIIGPRSQIITGLGDRLEWRPELGLGADPQEIPGAFADQPDAFLDYQAEAQPDQITLVRPDSGISKHYQLNGDGFRVTVESGSAGQTRLPLLLLDPQTWQPGGYLRYRVRTENPESVTWELENKLQVQVTADGAALSAAGFSEALPFLRKPEDPNADLPPGFFLPFPMSVIELQTQGSFAVEVKIGPPGSE